MLINFNKGRIFTFNFWLPNQIPKLDFSQFETRLTAKTTSGTACYILVMDQNAKEDHSRKSNVKYSIGKTINGEG